MRPTPRPDVPLIDRVKIQSERLVPLIKELEAELGTAQAARVRRSARRCLSPDGSGLGRQARRHRRYVRSSVTGCRYAEFFHQLGEPELGFLLVCSADFPIAEGIPGVELG